MAFHAADTHRATSEGAARKGRLKERRGLEPRTNFFFRLRNWQKLVRIRFENIQYIKGQEEHSSNRCVYNYCSVRLLDFKQLSEHEKAQGVVFS